MIPVYWFPGLSLPISDLLMQVAMHSQNHRGQCLTRLRELGGKPPTVDFIVYRKVQAGV